MDRFSHPMSWEYARHEPEKQRDCANCRHLEEYFNRDKRRIKAILNLKKLKRDKPGATLSVDAVIEILRRIGEGERE